MRGRWPIALAITVGLAGCGDKADKDTPRLQRTRAAADADGGRVLPPFGTGGSAAATPEAAPATAEVAAAPEPAATSASAAAVLPEGEYGCIGSGTTQLAGMGSKLLPGGRYTDLDGGSPGTYRIVGDTIVFTGGHLDGEVGRDIRNNGYTIGRMVSCQKW